MSSTEQTESTGHAHGRHPTARDYVNIALILAVLTALEVSTYFFEFGPIAVPLLIVLMIIKFILVVGWFMHLKFDSKIYSQLMYSGLAFALVLYAVTLTIMFLEPSATI